MKIRILLLALQLPAACDEAPVESGLPDAQEGRPELSVDAPETAEGEGAAYSSRLQGTLAAKETIRVAASATGTLASVGFRVGDTVKKGDVLFRLQGTTTKLSLSRAKKALEIAQQQLRTAQREFGRQERLNAKGASTRAVFEQAESDVDAAELQVENAKLNVSMSRSGVVDLVNRAPTDATVTARLKEPGETVTMAPATVVVELQNRSTLEARFDVPEAELADYPVGAQLEAYVPALRDARGIEVVRSGVEVDPATRTIEIICEIDNAGGDLKPGMSFEAARPDGKVAAK